MKRLIQLKKTKFETTQMILFQMISEVIVRNLYIQKVEQQSINQQIIHILPNDMLIAFPVEYDVTYFISDEYDYSDFKTPVYLQKEANRLFHFIQKWMIHFEYQSLKSKWLSQNNMVLLQHIDDTQAELVIHHTNQKRTGFLISRKNLFIDQIFNDILFSLKALHLINEQEMKNWLEANDIYKMEPNTIHQQILEDITSLTTLQKQYLKECAYES